MIQNTTTNPTPELIGFDSEFNTEKDIVYSVQFSDGNIFFNAEDLRNYIYSKNAVYTGFNILCDLGSLVAWSIPVDILQTGINYRATLKTPKLKTIGKFWDLKCITQTMGLYNLKAIAEHINLKKLTMPKDLISGNPDLNSFEFKNYAINDAIISKKFADYLIKAYDIKNLWTIYSGATVAKNYFGIPNRHTKTKDGFINCPHPEQMIHNEMYAGRNDCIVNGLLDWNVYYNDIVSQYPVTALITEALKIDRIELCDFSDLEITGDLSTKNYGWISGQFKCENDWGLPVKRNKRNYYVNGIVNGTYHTFDLVDSEILKVFHCYKPVFKDTPVHNKFRNTYFERLKTENKSRKKELKVLLNTLTGKLGQYKPIPTLYSNYPAYSTIYAASHLLLRILRRELKGNWYGCDTDSVFSDNFIKGEFTNVNNYSVTTSIKAQGKLAYFRSKLYYYLDNNTLAYNGIRYKPKDFFNSAIHGEFNNILTMQKRKTIKSRDSETENKNIGYWINKKIQIPQQDYNRLLTADNKRDRDNYDSLTLVLEKTYSSSKNWTVDELDRQHAERELILYRRYKNNLKLDYQIPEDYYTDPSLTRHEKKQLKKDAWKQFLERN